MPPVPGALLAALLLTAASCAPVAAPQGTTSSGSAADLEPVRQLVAELASQLPNHAIEFRLEVPGRAPVDVATGGATAGGLVDLGSVSKTVTAIGIALLIQDGRITLDSRLGDLLPGYFQSHNATMDPSLAPITVQDLLTHRAGLRGNRLADPAGGLESSEVTSRIGGEPHFLNYLLAGGGNHSNGRGHFLYSNLSYTLLGAVIEAVSGQDYQGFSQRRVFQPLGITDAVLPARWNVVGPFGGWQATEADVLRLRAVYDIHHPTLLTPATLRATLLAPLGGPVNNGGTVFYTLATYVRSGGPGAPYAVSHNGLAGYYRRQPGAYMFTESTMPGPAWVVSIFPTPDRDQQRRIPNEIRAVVAKVARAAAPAPEDTHDAFQ